MSFFFQRLEGYKKEKKMISDSNRKIKNVSAANLLANEEISKHKYNEIQIVIFVKSIPLKEISSIDMG